MKLLLVPVVGCLVLWQEITASHVWVIRVWSAYINGGVEIVNRRWHEGATPICISNMLRSLVHQSCMRRHLVLHWILYCWSDYISLRRIFVLLYRIWGGGQNGVRCWIILHNTWLIQLDHVRVALLIHLFLSNDLRRQVSVCSLILHSHRIIGFQIGQSPFVVIIGGSAILVQHGHLGITRIEYGAIRPCNLLRAYALPRWILLH